MDQCRNKGCHIYPRIALNLLCPLPTAQWTILVLSLLKKVARSLSTTTSSSLTSMASRAIHLKFTNPLEIDSFEFIDTLRQFISRRGPICQLRSDQGTNFVGARRELTQALSETDQQKIKTKLLEEQCDWFSFKMNVPAVSHMEGVWERQIRSVCNVLSSLLQNNGRQLDDESLRTLMCEAEAIVNSRPLTVTSLLTRIHQAP